MNKFTGTDILFLKRFIERGFRYKLFPPEDYAFAIHVREKIKIILENVLNE